MFMKSIHNIRTKYTFILLKQKLFNFEFILKKVISNIRMKYVRWLQKYIGVHIYGECGTHKCGKV